MLSLRVSRDKRGYDYIYLLLEARRRGRVENRLLYCGRWPTPCRVGIRPFDEETRARLEEAHPDVPFDWPALLKTLNAALGVSRPPASGPPLPPPSRSRRPGPPASSPSGRPGAPSRQTPIPPAMPRREQPLPTEVVLVSAELEEAEPEEHEREHEPEFDPVCESDRPFTAAIDLELITDEIVHIPVPESTPAAAASAQAETIAEAIPVGEHVFTEASGPATFDPARTAPGAGESAGADEQARRRRRRRRGGRGRGGKPSDIRQSSE